MEEYCLAKISRNVISIDINPDMLSELKRRANNYENVNVIEGDIQKLSILMKNYNIKNPVLLLLQNSLGTIEGNYHKVLSEMKSVAEKNNGEIILSLFCKESLKTWGLQFYPKAKEMIGEPDLGNTDFDKGIFVAQNGFTSKWWSLDEIVNIKKFFGGKICGEVVTPEFHIIHIAYNKGD